CNSGAFPVPGREPGGPYVVAAALIAAEPALTDVDQVLGWHYSIARVGAGVDDRHESDSACRRLHDDFEHCRHHCDELRDWLAGAGVWRAVSTLRERERGGNIDGLRWALVHDGRECVPGSCDRRRCMAGLRLPARTRIGPATEHRHD